jgi:hypothetical protein
MIEPSPAEIARTATEDVRHHTESGASNDRTAGVDESIARGGRRHDVTASGLVIADVSGTGDAGEARTAHPGPGSGWTAHLQRAAAVVPPVTVITATLFWYGYVATRARFLYFGVYLDMAGLSTQRLLLYGVETTYPVAALLLLAVLLALAAHLAVRWWLESARYRHLRPAAVVTMTLGALLVGRAVVGMLRPVIAATETPGVTPLSLTVGAPLCVYSLWLVRRLALRAAEQASSATTFWNNRFVIRIERAMFAAALGVLLVGLVWTANSFAGAYGAGRAHQDAETLHRRPRVVLYSAELVPALPRDVNYVEHGPESKYRHEYRDLRLLLQSDSRLFLVPAHWSTGASTIVVPYDDSVQLQLIPAT